MTQRKCKRILLKISGESFCQPGGFGIDDSQCISIAEKIRDVAMLGTEVAVVNGAGNILRGEAFSKNGTISRYTADYMGMLATIMNACALQETLEKIGQPARVLSAIEVAAICDEFTRRKAIKHLERKEVAILAGGTGNPFFTTDTCAALRASELGVDLLIKATKVDGVYDKDPMKYPDAKFYDHINYDDVLKNNLRIMDHPAISLCKENNIPIIVLNIFKNDNIIKAVKGEKVGTLIS